MRSLSPIRVLLLLAALVNVGHIKGDDVITTTAELNRCLTAVRVALSRRGVVTPPPHRSGAYAELRVRPARQV